MARQVAIRQGSSKAWCFTLNNYTKSEVRQIKNYIKERTITYLCYGKEKGRARKTPHLQGYVRFTSKVSFKTAHLLFPRAHLEAACGSPKENIKYCSKDGRFKEYGLRPSQGARGDLDVVRALAAEDGMRDVVAYHNLQQIRVAEKYLTYNEAKRNWKTEVIWIWGKSGVGKSRMAHKIAEQAVEENFYMKSDGSKWWDGYDKHPMIILDDFRPSWWKMTYMLRLLDRYACQVETKGGHRQILARGIVITSIRSPRVIYNASEPDEPNKQLIRRITRIIHMDVPFEAWEWDEDEDDSDMIVGPTAVVLAEVVISSEEEDEDM